MNERFSLTEAATELGVAADTLLNWEREQRIPRMKRYKSPGGGYPRPMISRERLEHIKVLRQIYGPKLRSYRVGYGYLPVGK
jgi:hypothetical protein